MADVMSAAQRSALMSRIRGSNTGPELVLRKALWARGFRYRVNYRIGRIRPDLVFITARLAVFVDGCFWHRCPLHGVMPRGNRTFWQAKLERNVQRDAEANQFLHSTGWIPLRFWEHEVDDSVAACVAKIEKVMRSCSPEKPKSTGGRSGGRTKSV